MNRFLKIGLRAVPFVVATLSVAGCADSSPSPSDQGFAALQSGDYTKARDIFADIHAKDPHDAMAELNLAVAYQNMGRMDLAEPLYRGVMVDGKSVILPRTTNASDANKSLADIACTNLKLGLKDKAGC
ncbi:MAG: tetratricopeptide repeat protein [Rhizomicrobium sp.]|jgi:tetratricopeptide (TPR) repeat protein